MCRDLLDKDPGNATAFFFLGLIAAKIGAVDFSATYFETALRLDPGNLAAAQNLSRLKAVAPPSRSAGTRYLLIKSWGYGFWSDVSQVLGSLLLAEVTGRIPVVHWGANSLFGDGSGRDSFERYFRPVSPVTLADLTSMESATLFPAKWNRNNLSLDDVAKWHGSGSRTAALYFLNRPEIIAVSDFFVGVTDVMAWLAADHPMHGQPVETVYRYLVDKYLAVQPDVQARCDAFFRLRLCDGPFAAIHLRGSDKVGEIHTLDAINRDLLERAKVIDPSWKIFLLTDDQRWRAHAQTIYADRIVTTECQRTDGEIGLHYLSSTDRIAAGLEILTDTLLALRADRFFGSGRSNVAAMIAIMKPWAPGTCTLTGHSVLAERNSLVHIAG